MSAVETLVSAITNSSVDIFEREIGNIGHHATIASAIGDYIPEQKRESEFGGRVLEAILKSVQHVSAEKLKSDINNISSSIARAILESPDKRFYIALGGSSNDVENARPCVYKSNTFLALLLLSCRQSDLLPYFVDFICNDKTMYTAHDTSVPHYIYFDDASLSGSQVTENGKEMARIPCDGKTRYVFHLAIMYISPTNILKIHHALKPFVDGTNVLSDIRVYTTGTHASLSSRRCG
ncbi:unnamed protein product [Hapterophycus canaliculatus]